MPNRFLRRAQAQVKARMAAAVLGLEVPGKRRKLPELLLNQPTELRIAAEREATAAADRQARVREEAERNFREISIQYGQGRRAEREQDWAGAVTHYGAIYAVQPEYRDVAVRYVEARQRVQQRKANDAP